MSTTTSAVRTARVGIIGTGFAGLGLAIRLRQAGDEDFIVLEKDTQLGGTWRDNEYPGCACDVPSNLYSYSFAPNPDWTTTFAHQAEIRAYTERVAADHDLHRSIHFDTFVQDAAWDAEAALWRVETSQGTYEFSVLVSATGPLSSPSIPNLPGLKDFDGPVFHSAEWDFSADLTGKRVAVIGTGASAIQFVPQLQKTVGELKLFQRTPPWLLPRAEFKTSRLRRALFARFPLAQRVARESLYWKNEFTVVGLTRRPGIMKAPQWLAKQHIKRQIPGDPELQAKVTPDFRLGCKRILLSSNYYPALAKPNVEVLTTGVSEIGKNSVVGSDGQVREVDAIVLGTGFHVNDLPIKDHVRGIGGQTLGEAWGDSMQGYRGATVPGFPNFFFILGPNTGLGHSSMIFMAEAAGQYVMDALAQMDKGNLASVDVRPERFARWNDGVQKRMKPTVWVTGGCASWYLDASGKNRTLWPDFTFRFRALTKRFDIESYSTLPRRVPQPSIHAAPAAPAEPAAPVA
ncbi:MAG: NAD(P)/FAD-dependent oxidoreductase [Solirubrobacteraceae bacterium]|nr:NAD(P)/FAD-dependent oxidoreductase [Solirubrobacteraceae bacterium]